MPELTAPRGGAANWATAFWPGHRRPLRDLLLSGAATVLLVGALIWVTVRTWHYQWLDANPAPAIMWCGEFVLIATALSAARWALLRRPVTALEVVATLAMWALLPPTLLAAYLSFGFPYAGLLTPLVVASPLLAVVTAKVLAARRKVGRTVGVLLPTLLIVAALTLLLPKPPMAWLILPGWHVLLATATVVAAAWDRAGARRTRAASGRRSSRG